MKRKNLKSVLFLFGITSLSINANTVKNINGDKNSPNKNIEAISSVKKEQKQLQSSNKTAEGYNLNFDVNKNYKTETVKVNGKNITYRAYENIVYVKNPVDINYQTINIYIPEEYFNGKTVGKYNEKTAPIFFPNSVGGYMPGAAGKPEIDKRKGKENASLVALSMGRQKTPGAFDNIDLSTGENNLFGDKAIDNKHFTKYMLEHSTVNGQIADSKIVKMMNPMYYIGTKGVTTSKYWRIRHGAVDKDTSLAIPAILALKLENLGKNVDFASPWAIPHSGDYDLDELFTWIDGIVQ